MDCAMLALRERMLRQEPPVVLVMRRQAIKKVEQQSFAVETSARAVQPEHAGRKRQHHRVAWKLIQMQEHRGCGGRCLPFDGEREDCDMLALAARC